MAKFVSIVFVVLIEAVAHLTTALPVRVDAPEENTIASKLINGWAPAAFMKSHPKLLQDILAKSATVSRRDVDIDEGELVEVCDCDKLTALLKKSIGEAPPAKKQDVMGKCVTQWELVTADKPMIPPVYYKATCEASASSCCRTASELGDYRCTATEYLMPVLEKLENRLSARGCCLFKFGVLPVPSTCACQQKNGDIRVAAAAEINGPSQ